MKNIIRIREAAATKEKQQEFAKDMAQSVDLCISKLTGLKGVMVKKSYQVIKSVRPGYIEHILLVMSPDFIDAFEPLHDAHLQTMTLPAETVTPFRDYLSKHPKEAFNAFISVSDKYAEKRKNSLVGKTYSLFRSQISGYFDQGIPYLADVVDKHTIVEA